MSNAPALSTLTLPADLVADDVLGLRDQLRARIAAILRPKGKKRAAGDLELPDGLAPLDVLPAHIERPWRRFDAATTDLQTFREARASARADEAHAATDETEKSAANADADDRWRAGTRAQRGSRTTASRPRRPRPAGSTRSSFRRPMDFASSSGGRTYSGPRWASA